MTISLLLATSHGQAQALNERAGKGGGGGFTLDLARAGATPPQSKGELPPSSGATHQALTNGRLAGPHPGDSTRAQSPLGDGADPLPGDATLAEIAERMALILSAGNTADGSQGGPRPLPNADATNGLAVTPTSTAALPLKAAGEPGAGGAHAQISADSAGEAAREAGVADLAAQVLAGQPPNAANVNAHMQSTQPTTQALAGQASAEGVLTELARSAEARQSPTLQAGRDGLEMIRAAGERAAAQQSEPVLANEAPKAAPPVEGAPRTGAGESSRESFSTLLSGGNTAGAHAGSTTHPGTPSASGQLSLNAPLGSQAWPQQFTQQLSQQVGHQMNMFGPRGGEQRVELHLHPAELGPLTVSLKVGEQAAQAQFLSAHAQVRSAVEHALPQLREALAEQGISLGETSVGEQRGQQSSGEQLAGRGRQGVGAIGDGADGVEPATTATPISADISLDGRVDLYA